MPDPARTRTVLREICLRAQRAPSVHNTQPWHFELGADSFTLVADDSRRLRILDPSGRQLMISLGCALFNARVAAAAMGVPVQVLRFPDDDSPDVVATVSLAPAEGTAVESALGRLDEVIEVRATNRRRFGDDPVPGPLLAVLHRAAEDEGARLVQISAEEDRLTVARLSQRADAIQYQNAAYRAELRAWTTNDPERLDGVPARVVPHVDAGSGDEIPIRDFDSTGAGWLPTDTRSTRNQCLLLLGTDGDDRVAWLRAGEALERILLEVAAHGFAASPLTQVVEVPSARAALRAELRLTMFPLVLLRVGKAARTPGTSRRRLDELVVEASGVEVSGVEVSGVEASGVEASAGDVSPRR